MRRSNAVRIDYCTSNVESKRTTDQTSALSPDYSLVYETLKNRYKKSKKPVPIDFRKLVDFHSGVDRYSHLLHVYPAKLLVNIPYFFLRCSSLLNTKGIVLDPFCGSGTVLLESIILGHNAVGADANPLARLISKVKSQAINKEDVGVALAQIEKDVRSNAKVNYDPQQVLDWDYWFSTKHQEELKKIIFAISKTKNKKLRDFFTICVSSCIRRVSYSDPNISVPVKLNAARYRKGGKKYKKVLARIKRTNEQDTLELFKSIVELNINRLSKLQDVQKLGALKKVCNDARNLTGVKENSVDLIITSPPYAGAQKYVRSSSLSMGWLRLCPNGELRTLEKKNIGREHYLKSEYQKPIDVPVPSARWILNEIWRKNPLRAHIAANYLIEMREALSECYRVLKPNSHLILVVGNNLICGHNFRTQRFLADICHDLGFKSELVLRDTIKSRGLMTKRNKTASMIACEWIFVLRK